MNNDFKVTFLGTCACNYARYEHRFAEDLKDSFDDDARRASAMLVDGHVMVDCGPHAADALGIVGASAEDITDIVITHLHDDHFVPENIVRIAEGRSSPLNLWVSEDAVLDCLENVNIKRMKKLESYDISSDIRVTGLFANHDPGVAPQHLLFEKNGKKLFYGCDGAWMMTATFNYLCNSGLDMMVLDGTVGDYEGDFRMAEHNSIPMIRLMLPSLKTKEIVTEKTKVYISHLAPRLHKSHAETVEIVKNDGICVAYDGLTVEI